MLDPKLALQLAARLTPVPEFPRNQEAIEAVAEDLIDLTRDCESQEAEYRIRKITQEIRRTWDAWTGTADLIRLYHRYWPEPRELKSEDNEVKNYGLKPTIECKACNDTGAVKRARFAKGNLTAAADEPLVEKYEWCECLTGVNLHFDMPGWLDLLNAKRPMILPEPVKPHPAADQPVSPGVENALSLNTACSACIISAKHTHAEFWKYHCKQEQPQ